MKAPVLIVGAGPVGLTLAIALKRRGVDLRIVEKAAARTDKSKALVIWPRTLELLDIQRCVQPFLDIGLKATGARIRANGDTLVHLDLGVAQSVYPYALMVAQSETERLLEAQLASLGVEVERQVELVSFTDDERGVTALLRHADGHDESIDAGWLAACDGAHSTVRHGLDLHFEGETLPSTWLLADVRLEGDVPADEVTICWTADGVLAIFPIPGGRFRVIADIGDGGVGNIGGDLGDAHASRHTAPQPPPSLGEVQAVLDQRGPPGLTVHDDVWLARFAINERKVKSYRHGHVFLAGDAAHIHSPAGGQGMNTGMQDAINLAWKLALVWHDDAAPSLLDSYSPERSAIGEQVLRNAGNMTRVALIRNPVLQEIRSLAAGALGKIPALRRKMVDQLTELDLHYADSPLTASPHGAARHPAAGHRAPDVPLNGAAGGTNGTIDNATRLHDLLASGRFVVLAVGAPAPVLSPAVKGIAVAASADSAEGYEPGHLYLIRPDAYLAMSTRAGDMAPIAEALQRIAG